MCTATWWFASSNSYEVFFNRDERKTRAPELPPEMYHRDGVRFLAPLDGECGGSWFACNEFGVTVCLLNHYPLRAHLPRSSQRSRGELIFACATAKTTREVWETVTATELFSFPPFRLLAFAPASGVKLLTWDGAVLENSESVDGAISSSSFQAESVLRERRRKFERLRRGGVPGARPPLEIFHDQHDPANSASSVLMNRPDACTVSQLHARISPEAVKLTYRAVNWGETRSRWRRMEARLPIRFSTDYRAS